MTRRNDTKVLLVVGQLARRFPWRSPGRRGERKGGYSCVWLPEIEEKWCQCSSVCTPHVRAVSISTYSTDRVTPFQPSSSPPNLHCPGGWGIPPVPPHRLALLIGIYTVCKQIPETVYTIEGAIDMPSPLPGEGLEPEVLDTQRQTAVLPDCQLGRPDANIAGCQCNEIITRYPSCKTRLTASCA